MSQGHSFIVPSSLGIWIMFHPLHSCTCTRKYLQITGFSVVVFHKKKILNLILKYFVPIHAYSLYHYRIYLHYSMSSYMLLLLIPLDCFVSPGAPVLIDLSLFIRFSCYSLSPLILSCPAAVFNGKDSGWVIIDFSSK